MKQWYEELFENYAETYEKESYVKGTMQEVDFIEQEIGHDKSIRILDIGCGTGRHAVELAKRGYQVTGIDLSAAQLKKAGEKAAAAGIQAEFIQADARELDFQNKFDLVIMLCEGAFSLMETDEMNFRILQNAVKALEQPGKIIFSTLNVLFPLYHSVRDFINENSLESEKSRNNTFDLMTFRNISTLETVDDHGRKMTLNCNERYYAPSEITWYLKSLGMKNIGIYGCQTGKYNCQDKLTTDDFEMLVIAEK